MVSSGFWFLTLLLFVPKAILDDHHQQSFPLLHPSGGQSGSSRHRELSVSFLYVVTALQNQV
jgi:hypothetical protein